MSDTATAVLETVTIGETTFTILFPELLRPLRKEERSALKRSIRKNGVIYDVIVDDEMGVIDGANRLRLAAECKLMNVNFYVQTNLTLEQKTELAMALNDSRRHLSPEEWREIQAHKPELIAKAQELAFKQASQRTIARVTGMSLGSVNKAVNEDRVTGVQPRTPVTPRVTEGADGKVYASPEVIQDRREKVVELSTQGLNQREIAAKLGVIPMTVSRDLKAVEALSDHDDIHDEEEDDRAEKFAEFASLLRDIRQEYSVLDDHPRAEKVMADIDAFLCDQHA